MAWPIAMDLAMQVPRWAGHDKEIRRPQRIAARNDVRRSEFQVWSPGSKLVVSREVAKNPSVRTNHVTVIPLATWLLRTCQHRSSPVSILHTTSMCESLPAMTSWDVRVGRLIGGHGSSMNIHGGLRAFCRSKSTDTVGPVEVNPWMANLDALGVGRNHRAFTVFWWILTKTGSYRRIYAYKACILAKTGKNVKLADFRSSWGSRWWRWSGFR